MRFALGCKTNAMVEMFCKSFPQWLMKEAISRQKATIEHSIPLPPSLVQDPAWYKLRYVHTIRLGHLSGFAANVQERPQILDLLRLTEASSPELQERCACVREVLGAE
jgi:hypothetical protein